MSNKGVGGKLPKNNQPVIPSFSDVTGQVKDVADPKNELLSTLQEESRSTQSDQNGGSSADTSFQGHRQEPMIEVSAAHLQDLIAISIERGLRSVNERVSLLADKLESLENASATWSASKTAATISGPSKTAAAISGPEIMTTNNGDISESEVTIVHPENTINIAEQPSVEVSSSEKQVIRPHDFITNDPLESRMERDISEAFYYALVIVPEELPEVVPRDVLQETLALEQRGEFASIPQSFIFKTLQILRELEIHVCKTFPSARSNLFHLLTGQSCTCEEKAELASEELISTKALVKSRAKQPSSPPSDHDSSSSSTSSRSDRSGNSPNASSSSSDSSENSERIHSRHQGNRSIRTARRAVKINPKGPSRSDKIGRHFVTVLKLYVNNLFRGGLDESVFLHLKQVKSTFRQLSISKLYRGSLISATLGGAALTYVSELWGNTSHNALSWSTIKVKLIHRYGSRYHVEAADAVLREMTLKKVIRSGEYIMEGMERLVDKLRHLTSIVSKGKERRSDLKRALLFAIATEWFTSKLPSYMDSVEDVMLQTSRVVRSRRYLSTSDRDPQKSFFRNLEGRQYDPPPQTSRQTEGGSRRKNPTDSQGRIMLCRGCGAADHFILQCPKKRESIQALFEQLTVSDPPVTVSDPQDNDGLELIVDEAESDSNFIAQIQDSEAVNMAVTLRKHAELCKFGLGPSSSLRQSGEPFLGVCVDTGTTRTMVGSSQFRALCIVMGYTPKLRSSSRRFRCGNLTHPSLGYFSFRLPIGKSHFHSIDVDVVDVSNPFLLGLNDLHAIQARIDLSDFSWTIAGERSKLVHKNQHLWLPLSFDDSCCFTQAELTLLHRRLGHPQADRMLALLRRAKPLDIDKDTKSNLTKFGHRAVHASEQDRNRSFFEPPYQTRLFSGTS
jgi:hypothetical protein